MGHAAGVPRYEHRGDGHRVFYGAAEQSAFEPAVVIQFLKQVAGENNRQVLVGSTGVEEETRCDSRADGTLGFVDKPHEEVGNAANHLAGRHHSAETHGADDEPDGIHHAPHTSGGYQCIDFGLSGRQRGAPEYRGHQGLEAGGKVERIARDDLQQNVRLENQDADGGDDRRDEERDNRGELGQYEYPGDEGYHQQPGRQVELLSQRLGKECTLGAVGMAHGKSGYGKDDEGDDHRRHGSNQHVAYVGEEFGPRGRRGEYRGIG